MHAAIPLAGFLIGAILLGLVVAIYAGTQPPTECVTQAELESRVAELVQQIALSEKESLAAIVKARADCAALVNFQADRLNEMEEIKQDALEAIAETKLNSEAIGGLLKWKADMIAWGDKIAGDINEILGVPSKASARTMTPPKPSKKTK